MLSEAMTEELPSVMELKEYSQPESKAMMWVSEGAKPWGSRPQVPLASTVLSPTCYLMVLWYLAWCDYYEKGSHCDGFMGKSHSSLGNLVEDNNEDDFYKSNDD